MDAMNRRKILLLVIVAMLWSSYSWSKDATVMGTAYSPANFPNSSSADLDDFYKKADEIGNHVQVIIEWKDNIPLSVIQGVQARAKKQGLAFYVYLSPIALYGGRKEPDLPAPFDGQSFSNPFVRIAFMHKALELAELKPDLLGLGTEVNLLAENPKEFSAYASLVRDAARKIKKKYPAQKITVSFQWDVMISQKKFAPLKAFKKVLDSYSFTTYPSVWQKVDNLPSEYYSSIRKLLPSEPIGFSEVGWIGGEEEQAKYFERLPDLLRGAKPQYVTLALLHDVNVLTGELEFLNHAGILYADGRPKKCYAIIKNYA